MFVDRKCFGGASAALLLSLLPLAWSMPVARAETGTEVAAVPAAPEKPRRVDIWEYRVDGAQRLSQDEVETAVYPFLGPGRQIEDVEAARAALEKAYVAKGYQTVSVEIPPQQVQDGVVTLKVVEGRVGRLRVRGSRYFDLDEIKAAAPSLAEGAVPNFNEVSRDIIALNQIPDRRVTPSLRAGATPGTVDVDLNVEDSFPLHGSLEVNNRYSKDTSKLRLTGALRYDNLWQLGHSLSLGYQVAPTRPNDGKVYSGSYLARFPSLPNLSFLLYGVKQDSDVTTLGALDVVGKGDIIGARTILSLPGADTGFFHTLSVGIDRKRFQERVSMASEEVYSSPVTYYPISLAYAATWAGEGVTTQANVSAVFNLRPLGSGDAEFENKRYGATGGFFYARGDLSRQQDLDEGAQAWGKVQAQASNAPLISSEQFAAGGLDTVRGYLESEALGDNAVLWSAELRSPSLGPLLDPEAVSDWRFHLFVDGGYLTVRRPLDEQASSYTLWSLGVGTRIKLFEHINGSFDLGVPMVALESTHRLSPRGHFRIWGEF